MPRADSLEKTLMLGKIEGRKERGLHRLRWLGGTIDSMDMSLSKLWEIVKDWEAWRAAVQGFKELGMTYQLNNNNNKLLLFKWKRWEIESNKNIFLRKSGHQTKLDFVILNP